MDHEISMTTSSDANIVVDVDLCMNDNILCIINT